MNLNNLHLLIVEDELPAAKRLELMIKRILPFCSVDHCSSIKESVIYLQNVPKNPDLIFMDIRLGDGLSFEIFNQIEIKIPVIFTTAYDEYAIKAFKVNSIDYLLKPIEESELQDAVKKFIGLNPVIEPFDFHALTKLIINSGQTKHFFSKQGEKTTIVKESEILYFYSENGYTHCRTTNGSKFILDESIEEISTTLSQNDYFKINRGMMIKKVSVKGFEPYFNNRLFLTIVPTHHESVIVAREKVKEFRNWLKS